MGALRSNRITYVLVGTAGLALAYGVMFLGSGAQDVLMGEDALVEYAGALGLLAASLFFFLAFLRSRGGPYGRVKRLVLLGLALVFFLGAGEEISWGQRILGIETPEELSEANVQDELNFHNLDVFDGLLTPERLFQVFWVSFGVVIPLACALWAGVRDRLSRWVPVLPVWVASLFVISQLLAELVSRILADNPQLYHGEAAATTTRFELTESVVSVLFALAGLVVLAEVLDRREGARTTPPPPIA